MMTELLVTLVRLLVDQPDEVSVNVIELDGTLRYELRVAPGDVGRVIGRQGRVIRALRVVMRSVGAGERNRVELELAADGR